MLEVRTSEHMMSGLPAQLLIIVSFCLMLGGCTAPDFRSAVFQKFGTDATVIAGPEALPREGTKRYRQNSFRYAPGSLFRFEGADDASVFDGKAGLIDNIVGECFQRAITVNRMTLDRPADYELRYTFDASVAPLSSKSSSIEAFRKDFEIEQIPQNAFVYLKEVVISLRDIHVYQASPSQIDEALQDIASRYRRHHGFCGSVGAQANISSVVEKIYVANVSITGRWDRGLRIGLQNYWNATIQRSFRYSYLGNRMIFAVKASPLSGTTLTTFQSLGGTQRP